jgi:hypothetical protein
MASCRWGLSLSEILNYIALKSKYFVFIESFCDLDFVTARCIVTQECIELINERQIKDNSYKYVTKRLLN